MSDDEMDITAAGMQGGDLTKDDAMMLGGGEDGDADSWAPLEVGQEKDLTKDGGVKKKLVHKGEGWKTPEAGDEVTGASLCPCCSPSCCSLTHSACVRSSLRGHLAGRHQVRQQPRPRRAVQVHARKW
jgi:hypothetical protein